MTNFALFFQNYVRDWLEPVGIISGLLFSGIALRNDVRSRRIENHIKLAEGYRAIWSAVITDPTLERVRRINISLKAKPVTPAEDRLVRFIFQNILLAFEARNARQLGDIGNLELDVADFMARPIPRAVWEEIAQFQPAAFRKFVENLM
jgi:hypothetical protein